MSELVESLKELEDIAQLLIDATARRNQIILAARIDGWTIEAVAGAAKLSVSGIIKISDTQNGGQKLVSRRRQQKVSFE